MVIVDSSCVAVFKDGSALGYPVPTGAGAAIYHYSLDEDPVCISKPVCSNGFNYIGAHWYSESIATLGRRAKSEKGRSFFVDCQQAIFSAFGTDIPEHNVDVILSIRQLFSFVHWIPGHTDSKGNELATNLAKNGAKEMVGTKEDFFEGVADRAEQEKWQKIYVNSTVRQYSRDDN